jgi:hypothetical protein
VSGSPRRVQRARRLVRLYPPAWRARYGEEFAELLIADLAERPRSVSRTADVARGAVLARLSASGLAGQPLDPVDQVRSCLAMLAFCLACFLTFGVALWSQLTVGWQWSAPRAPATAFAMHTMSAALVAMLLLLALASVPIVFVTLKALLRRDVPRIWASTILFFLGTTVLIVGGRHFGHAWPGTGGKQWAGKGLVPAGPAAFAWANTLSITSYWAHPGKLGTFPASEIAWMTLAPPAILCTATSAARLVRTLRLSPRALRYQTRLAGAATIAMLAFLCGATVWVLDGDAGPKGLFASGAIDELDIAMMAATLSLSLHTVRRARIFQRA